VRGSSGKDTDAKGPWFSLCLCACVVKTQSFGFQRLTAIHAKSGNTG
jgi:hypothetical protein